LEVLPDAYVPVYVVFEDEGGGEVLFDDSFALLASRIVGGGWFREYFCSAFMWVLQLPRMPGGSPMFSDGGGYALWRMLSPVTPSTKSRSRLLEAAASVIASRRSVRKGRFRTKIFWNFELSAGVRCDVCAKRGFTMDQSCVRASGRSSPSSGSSLLMIRRINQEFRVQRKLQNIHQGLNS
jgi:hypothetical protein